MIVDVQRLMSETKFYESYSRFIPELSRYETWEEAVKRVMNMHRTYYADKLAQSDELADLINFAEEAYLQQRMLGAQRALQFGGEQILAHHIRMYNCLGRETRFITSLGVKSFTDFRDGDTVTVLTHTGAWKPAVVRNYGKGKLRTITFRKNNTLKKIRATDNHRWLLHDGTVTTELKVGDRLLKEPETFAAFDWDTADSAGSKFNAGWKVVSIEGEEVEDVWCLEVEDDRSFILEGGLVTGNCVSSWLDRPAFFGEYMYVLLGGAGAGFSVQRHHVNKLPEIAPRTKGMDFFVVPDNIEGWAEALDVLMSSYLTDKQKHPRYAGKKVIFDYSQVRPKGAPISGGFKAPGPEPLAKALKNIELLLERILAEGVRKLRPIHVYDISMHAADAVISGGVRRAATICLFDKDDEEMLKAKTGNWMKENPQRARSNNSAVCVRDELTRDEFHNIMVNVRQFGEPGFVFTDNRDFTFNPCVEIGMYPVTEDGESGWQMCNLVEINGGKCVTPEDFYLACKASAIIGTLQAGYTNFKFLSEATKRIVEREALLGVSITGWMNNPHVLFDEDVLRRGARIVKEVNAHVAKLIGINAAARTTCAKPAGSTSVLLGTASGIHGEHAPRYLRNMEISKDLEVGKELARVNPVMVEDSVWKQNTYCVSFPITAPENSIFKKDLIGIKQLEYVKKAQQVWVEEGTNVELCTHPALRHNISNTIQVKDWDEIEEYIYENRQWFAGISLLDAMGDRDYPQAPFTTVLTGEEIVAEYGDAAMFASGLIVEGVKAFGDLWKACEQIEEWAPPLPEGSATLLKRDWVRRLRKFAANYFGGDLKKATYCLKDVYNLHRWNKICREIKPIEWSEALKTEHLTDVDTIGAIACSGGVCEWTPPAPSEA